VALDKGNAKVQNGLGISLYVHGDIQDGFEHLREAVRINPLSAQNRFVLGRFMLDQGHAEQALPDLLAAIAIRPHFESCEESLASAYEALDRNPEALAHWQKAQVIDPGRAGALIGAAWLLATAPEASLRNGAEAVRLAERAKDIEPNNAEVLDTLGAAYAEQGQFKHALAEAGRALELAKAQANQRLAAAIRTRAALYAKQKPFHGERTPAARGQALDKVHAAKEGQ
jgi:tetratricopeptide (TPR) repeat protein